MNRKLCFLIGLLAAGSLHSEEPAFGEAYETWRENRLAWGKEVYGNYCAGCHEPGASQAPAIRDRNAWSTRSPLWSAVLFEHAKSGYLEMPARGDHPELSDVAVDAAAEYMLSETYPELPLD
jgi:cytochrome c5